MDIIDTLRDDYRRFPEMPTYEIYADDVYFKDPLTEFRGLQRYQKMIQFMATWFKDVHMDLHNIYRQGNIIHTQWTLQWTTPVPWEPRISISGRSELILNPDNRIISHIDYWDCSRWNVIQQHLKI